MREVLREEEDWGIIITPCKWQGQHPQVAAAEERSEQSSLGSLERGHGDVVMRTTPRPGNSNMEQSGPMLLGDVRILKTSRTTGQGDP